MTRARQTLKRMLARYPLPAILGALRPTEARYLSLPLDNQRLRSFVVSEVKTIEHMVAK